MFMDLSVFPLRVAFWVSKQKSSDSLFRAAAHRAVQVIYEKSTQTSHGGKHSEGLPQTDIPKQEMFLINTPVTLSLWRNVAK